MIPVSPWYKPAFIIPLAGMMTGQILSGGDPLIAARYQIVVMTKVMGAGGISAAIYLTLASSTRP